MLTPCSHTSFLFFAEGSTPRYTEGNFPPAPSLSAITVTFSGAQRWCTVFLFHCVGRNSLLQFTDKQWCVWDNLQACRWRVSQRGAFRDATQEPWRSLHLPILSMNVGIHANHADHMKAWLSLNMNSNNSWTLIYQPLHSECVPSSELQWRWEGKGAAGMKFMKQQERQNQ